MGALAVCVQVLVKEAVVRAPQQPTALFQEPLQQVCNCGSSVLLQIVVHALQRESVAAFTANGACSSACLAFLHVVADRLWQQHLLCLFGLCAALNQPVCHVRSPWDRQPSPWVDHLAAQVYASWLVLRSGSTGWAGD